MGILGARTHVPQLIKMIIRLFIPIREKGRHWLIL